RAEVHPLVAQGCRPVGDPYTTTAADGNVIFGLGGQPPLDRVRGVGGGVPRRDRAVLQQGGQLGVVIYEWWPVLLPVSSPVLTRGIGGTDPNSGAIAVGDEVEVGQTVQFHIRDADSADEDLRRTLERELAALGGRRAAGALLFTCNGRGSRMFSEPDHDAGLLAAMLGT